MYYFMPCREVLLSTTRIGNTEILQNVRLPSKAFWALKKILNCRVTVDSVGGWDKLQKGGVFLISLAYKLLRPQAPKVQWSRLICHNIASPKSVFILWLALHGRLATCDRVVKWVPIISFLCPLCQNKNETLQHMFFECQIAGALWRRLLHMMHHTRQPSSWHTKLRYAIMQGRRKTTRAQLYVAAFTKAVYEIWRQRNDFLHQQRKPSVDIAYNVVLYRLACRVNLNVRHLLPNLSIVQVT